MKEFFIKLGLSAVAALAPVHGVMVSVGILIIFDLITGLWRAYKRGEKITSNGLRRTITKLVAYQMLIVSGFIMEAYLGLQIPVAKIVGGYVAITEGKSIFENMETILGVNLWNEALKKLQGSKEVEK